jgi:hypothetical protein
VCHQVKSALVIDPISNSDEADHPEGVLYSPATDNIGTWSDPWRPRRRGTIASPDITWWPARLFDTGTGEIMADANPRYWFPAKRYGWGWGIPATWQGWLVLIAFVALVAAGPFLFPLRQAPAAFAIYIAVLVAVLTFVCWLTGEPARWRWGDDGQP